MVYRVCNPVVSDNYPVAFTEVWRAGACTINWPTDIDAACATKGIPVPLSPTDRAKSDEAYIGIGLSIATFEASPEVNAFTAKVDYTFGGGAKLSKEEQRGFALFRGKGMCHKCHPGNGQEALFTDFTFDNLGLPQNPENPAGGALDFIDPGLGGFLMNAGYPEGVSQAEWGKHKVPTLRNVDLRPSPDFVKAYGHNGYFKTLEGLVHFYNTRDVKPVCPGPFTEDQDLAAGCWPAPEVPTTINTDELGDLGLTPAGEAAIVAFLRALSDGYQP